MQLVLRNYREIVNNIVLKNGCLEAVGSHRNLIKKCTYYSELYNMQAEYFMIED